MNKQAPVVKNDAPVTLYAGDKLYFVARKEDVNEEGVTTCSFTHTGLFTTLKEASKVLRELGGGKKGNDDDLVIISNTLGRTEEKEYEVVTVVKGRNMKHAQSKVFVK